MPRYKLLIEYDGTNFCGWQYQPALASIQGAIQEALFNITQHSCELHVAGRTDAGVHAFGQVAHVELEKEWLPSKLAYGVNHFLKESGIAILNVERISDDFHARFSAKSRSYIYKIINRLAPPALYINKAYHVVPHLNVTAMNHAASLLLGYHDFSTFRASECQAKSPFKTLDIATFIEKEGVIEFHIKSKSFLHHQVRNIVGTLCLVGKGKWLPEDVHTALLARDRTKGGPTAPAHGLYLNTVEY
jgi:tRNA pseudouridine38-40 synthase